MEKRVCLQCGEKSVSKNNTYYQPFYYCCKCKATWWQSELDYCEDLLMKNPKACEKCGKCIPFA